MFNSRGEQNYRKFRSGPLETFENDELANSHLVPNPQYSGSRRGCEKLIRMVRLVIKNVRNDVSGVFTHPV